MASRLITLLLLVLTLSPKGMAMEVVAHDQEHPEIRALQGAFGDDLLRPRGDHRGGAVERVGERLDGVAPPGFLAVSAQFGAPSCFADPSFPPDATTCRPLAERLPYYATAPPSTL